MNVRVLVPTAISFLLAICCSSASAALPIPPPPDLGASSYILIDATTGYPVAASAPDLPVEPASLTKLMTAYVVFQALDAGQIDLNDNVTISDAAHAAGLAGSRMFAEIGSQVSVEDLLQGMIVQSGNDSSVALAEHVAGSESVFAGLMNAYANELGMRSSNFKNSHGLPAEGHVTTARDMATLARAIIAEFPDYYRWYGQREFTWNDITQPNRNGLLSRDPSVDGMKTGYTEAAGYCLVASASRDDMRLVSAVMGTASTRARETGSQSLLNYGFRFFETRQAFASGASVDTQRVWYGESNEVTLGVAEDVWVTVPRGRYEEVVPSVTLPGRLEAPLAAGAEIGILKLTLDGDEITRAPLTVLQSVEEGGFFKRMGDGVRLWFE
ncbi:MAG: D-alanyl-D-alanine carboxypeptidase family protein [Pseudomonadota bacterium]